MKSKGQIEVMLRQENVLQRQQMCACMHEMGSIEWTNGA